MKLPGFKKIANNFAQTPLMPVLFFGHGSPTNAIEDNIFTQAWQKVGQELPKPNAILCISAHWFVDGTFVHGSPRPQTIHDYYGFPPELYDIKYDCPGAPLIAKEVQKQVKSTTVLWDEEWGLDHGCWVVIKHLFPNADVPVFQMSIDFTKSSEFHYQLAKELSFLRRRGVLIVCSGNIVHNLGQIVFDEFAKPYDWANEFDEVVAKYITDGNHLPLINYQNLGRAAHLSIPTPDHYWPLLYALSLQEKNETPTFFAEGLVYKSISMRSLIIK